MLVVGGPASKALAEEVGRVTGVDVAQVDWKLFPDGESYLRLDRRLEGETVVIVQSTHPPQDTHLLQLLLLTQTAYKLGAGEVMAAVPYLAYSRQDKMFREYEAVSAEAILKLLGLVGLKGLWTFDLHEPDILRDTEFEAKNLSAGSALYQYFKEKDLIGAFAVAPDKKALRMSEEAAKVLGGGYGYFIKARDRQTGEIQVVGKSQMDVKGRDAIIFDDIISTGGTIAAAAKILKDQGAKHVYAACVHPLLVKGAIERLFESGVKEIVGTNTVRYKKQRRTKRLRDRINAGTYPPETTIIQVSVAQILAKALEKRGLW